MPLFDRYIAVDWSASNRARTGKDSIWIAEVTAGGLLPSRNPRTRAAAMADLETTLAAARARGERVMAGFDFPFGYPAGASLRLAGAADWAGLWTLLAAEIVDGDDNQSNRFLVAAAFNRRLGPDGPRFWGCPKSAAGDALNPRKYEARFGEIAEFRLVERVARGAKSTWQLFYNGAVGSQCLLGLARLQRLRARFGSEIAIWPFETDFERRLEAPIVLAEIYPSLDGHDPAITPKDRAQVEAQVRRFSRLDQAGQLGCVLSLPEPFAAQRDVLLREEGWIVGAGHERQAA